MKEFGTPLKLDRVSLGQCLQRSANDPNALHECARGERDARGGGGSCSYGKRIGEGKWRCVDGMAPVGRACFMICLLHESGEGLLHDLLASREWGELAS